MKQHIDIIKKVFEEGGETLRDNCIYHYGSQTIEGASTPNSDYDYLVLVGYNGVKAELAIALTKAGFELQKPEDEKKYVGRGIRSWRRDDINLVTCNNLGLFKSYIKANEVCRFLKVTEKQDRWRVFDAISYNRDPFDDTRKKYLPKYQFDDEIDYV